MPLSRRSSGNTWSHYWKNDPSMDSLYELTQRIGYFQVDQHHSIRLSSLFQLFQEAAIHHANQWEIGTSIMEDKGESWILNRVAMQLDRYPRLDETVTIQTWAPRLTQFKGFREFRIVVGGETIGRISTLWLYINIEKKAFSKIPFEIEQAFPVRPDDIYFESLDRLRLPKPKSNSLATSISLRYTDIDGNHHVNNAAYMDMIQTALHHQNLDTRPRTVEIQFAREISPDAESVTVQLESADEKTIFGIGTAEEVAAFGRLA